MVDLDGFVKNTLRHRAVFYHADRARAAVGLVWVDLNLPGGGEWKKAIFRTRALPRHFAGDFPGVNEACSSILNCCSAQSDRCTIVSRILLSLAPRASHTATEQLTGAYRRKAERFRLDAAFPVQHEQCTPREHSGSLW